MYAFALTSAGSRPYVECIDRSTKPLGLSRMRGERECAILLHVKVAIANTGHFWQFGAALETAMATQPDPIATPPSDPRRASPYAADSDSTCCNTPIWSGSDLGISRERGEQRAARRRLVLFYFCSTPSTARLLKLAYLSPTLRSNGASLSYQVLTASIPCCAEVLMLKSHSTIRSAGVTMLLRCARSPKA